MAILTPYHVVLHKKILHTCVGVRKAPRKKRKGPCLLTWMANVVGATFRTSISVFRTSVRVLEDLLALSTTSTLALTLTLALTPTSPLHSYTSAQKIAKAKAQGKGTPVKVSEGLAG